MSDLPKSFLEYVNRRGYNTFDKPEESLRHRKPWSYKRYRENLQNELDNLYEGEEVELYSAGSSAADSAAVAGTSTGEAVASIASGAGTVVGSSSLTPIVTVGLGALAAAAGAGIVSQVSKTGIQVPGTNYVGPGNPLDNGKPTSLVDEDAREHDISYSKSSNPIDISFSDSNTIQKFGDHFIEDNSDITALIGRTGLQIKKAVEKHTGQLYPKRKLQIWLNLILMLIFLKIKIFLLKIKDSNYILCPDGTRHVKTEVYLVFSLLDV